MWFHVISPAVSLTCHCGPQCISGTDTWQRVNTGMPVKSPRFALFDLAEGKSYSFRVRCCNSAGVGETSVSTEEITVGDKLGETRTYIIRYSLSGHIRLDNMTSAVYHDIISVLSSCISYILSLCFLHYVLSDSKPLYSLCARCDQPYFLSFFCIFSTDLPSAPGNPVGIRNTNTSVVVSWGASKDAKHLVGYYIECSQVGTDIWMPCNNKPVKQRRYAQLKIFNSWFINSKSHSLIKRWFDCVVEKKSSLHAHNLEAVRKSEFYTNINCRCSRLNWISANWKCKDGILVEK